MRATSLFSKQLASLARLHDACLLLAVVVACLRLAAAQGQECFSCKKATCKRIRGIFTKPSLPIGYNMIARIPALSCNVTVVEVTPSSNFLALRSSDGYIINGNWHVVPSGKYMGAGTGFLYSNPSAHEAESIYAPGPIRDNVDVMVIYQSNSLNIQYEYWLPLSKVDLDTNPVSFLAPRPPPVTPEAGLHHVHRPNEEWGGRNRPYYGRRRLPYPRHQHRYLDNVQPSFVSSPPATIGNQVFPTGTSWRVWKFTPCSKTCGGGVQETVHICTGSEGQILEDYHCGDSRPPPEAVACNTRPCPPRWIFGEWSQCSVTCGTGQMTRILNCVQEVADGVTRILSHTMCPLSSKPRNTMSTMQLCNIAPCTRWHVSPWGQCSVDCGTGIRIRDVFCQAEETAVSATQCNEQEKPFHQELCHSHLCAKHTWFFTEWSEECIGGCENGVHVRRVWCSPGVNSIKAECSLTERPPHTKPCTSDQACGAAWFTGPWSPCSSECGNGTRNREVVCVVYLRGSFRATFENECDPDRRPESVGICNTEICPPHWYFTDWTECTRKCGRGSQRRAVQCLDSDQRPSLLCQIDERPRTTKPCNTHSCSDAKYGNCIDRFQNCMMVQKARLCKYTYYKTVCCASCRTA